MAPVANYFVATSNFFDTFQKIPQVPQEIPRQMTNSLFFFSNIYSIFIQEIIGLPLCLKFLLCCWFPINITINMVTIMSCVNLLHRQWKWNVVQMSLGVILSTITSNTLLLCLFIFLKWWLQQNNGRSGHTQIIAGTCQYEGTSR